MLKNLARYPGTMWGFPSTGVLVQVKTVMVWLWVLLRSPSTTL